ncbi:MAG TPA: cytochrome c biogenesis protein CcdA [Candidatus Krumholzibacteria bacterium]|nr:cytochrome c biogenesis protein CcdA [Candidatus Krumholzibacteria bacterium]
MTKRILLLLAFLMPLAAGSAPAQLPDPFGDPVAATGYVSLSNVPQGGSAQLAIEIRITEPWHINANPASEEFLVPTEVAFSLPDGVTLRGIVYPAGVEKTLAFAENPLRLYEGVVYVGAVVDVADNVPLGTSNASATITYQACDNEKCLLPQTLDVPIALTISSPRDPVDLANPEVFDRVDFSPVIGTTGGDSGSDGDGAGTNQLKDAIAKRGWLFAYVLVFLGGLALNLTPCVYPMIPITVSYFGGQAKGRGGRTVLLATLYLLGMAAMYSTLGLIAALTGSLFGSALQNPFVLGVIAIVMVGLALSMFGVYEIRVPTRLAGLAGTAKRGTLGSFLMGLTVGIVAAPCIGPFVLGLLTFVGETANPVLGFSLFFVLAIGLGLPFVILAVASGNITRLPKSGEWMEWVRKLFGIVLLGMAAYFLRPVVGDTPYFLILGAVLVIGGVLLGFVSKVKTSSLFFSGFRRFVGVVAPLYGLYLVLAPGNIFGRTVSDGIAWIPYAESALAEAIEQGKPVVIDFSAEWCLPCKELDHQTFNQPEVIDAAKDVVPLKADLTQHGSPEVRALRRKFDIRGVPTIVFIDAAGRERANLRAVEFIDKEEFLSRLTKLTS